MNGKFYEEENDPEREMMIEEILNDNEDPESITDNAPETTPGYLNDRGPDKLFSEGNEQYFMADYEYLDNLSENLKADKSDGSYDKVTNENKIDKEKKPETFVDKVRKSEIGKMVFGEDGKFDHRNIEKIAESAKSAVKDVANILKSLLRE